MEVVLKAIGVIHTPFNKKRDTPIQSARSTTPGSVEIFLPFLDGLDGIEQFSHIYLIYGFHKSGQAVRLKVQPFLDNQIHGVFATRFPCRPNPLGLSIIRLTGRKNNILAIEGADMLDGTPLFDIKPYIPEFDVFAVDKIGWYQSRAHP